MSISYFEYDFIPEKAGHIVDSGLESSNQHAANLHRVRSMSVFAKSNRGEIIAGAIGRSWGKCCELQRLWVAGDQRNRGIGKEILTRFELMARNRQCDLVYLETFSFQAPDFYVRNGYAIQHIIKGFEDEISKLYLQKHLEI